ncbi:hypothetical protein BgiBS90_005593, partial [Biomphalaria glabrata]
THTHRLLFHGWNHLNLFGDPFQVDDVLEAPTPKKTVRVSHPEHWQCLVFWSLDYQCT